MKKALKTASIHALKCHIDCVSASENGVSGVQTAGKIAYFLPETYGLAMVGAGNSRLALTVLPPASTPEADEGRKYNMATPAKSFQLGKLVATPGALEAMEESGESCMELIGRHVRNDWGELTDEDKALNELALVDGSRILSAYVLRSGRKIWVITEADRSSTCILLPEEY